jgi:hypothetical protein
MPPVSGHPANRGNEHMRAGQCHRQCSNYCRTRPQIVGGVRAPEKAILPRHAMRSLQRAAWNYLAADIESNVFGVGMSLWEALVLGVVQGLTEFLPISSTAHLRVVPALAGWDDPGAPFTAVIQIGTLAAVLVYFRADIVRIVQATLLGLVHRRPLETLDSRLGWMIVLGTVPIVVCGLTLKKHIESTFRDLYVVSGSLIGLAIVLALAEAWLRRRERVGLRPKQLDEVTFTDAVVVGLA